MLHGLLLNPVTSARASASSLPPALALGSVSYLRGCCSVFLGLWFPWDRLWFRVGVSQPLPMEPFPHSIRGNEGKSLIRLPIRVVVCGCSLSNLTSEEPLPPHKVCHGPGSTSAPLLPPTSADPRALAVSELTKHPCLHLALTLWFFHPRMPLGWMLM